MRKRTAYDENSRMGKGDPLRMAGLDVAKPKLKTPKKKKPYKQKRERSLDEIEVIKDKYGSGIIID